MSDAAIVLVWLSHSKFHCWKSSDHHAHSDVVVIIWVLGLVSVLTKDRFEGIITNNFSEGLESDRVDDIAVKSGRDFHSDSFNLIYWNAEHLRSVFGSRLGRNKARLFWWLSMTSC